jgi:hypothetical protein
MKTRDPGNDESMYTQVETCPTQSQQSKDTKVVWKKIQNS